VLTVYRQQSSNEMERLFLLRSIRKKQEGLLILVLIRSGTKDSPAWGCIIFFKIRMLPMVAFSEVDAGI